MAEFGPLHVDFDCTEFVGTSQLLPVGQAVYDALTEFNAHRTFCGNKHESLIRLPSVSGDPNHDPNHPHQSAFIRYADLIATARHEVIFTTMTWEMPLATTDPETGMRSAGPLALLGRDPATGVEPSPEDRNGLEKLYNDVMASHEDYPYGVNVRILLGLKYDPLKETFGDQRPHVLRTLKEAGISLCEPEPDCEWWRVEVAYYKVPSTGSWSHVKLLAVDRQEAIVGGYNVTHETNALGTYDLGVQVSGPAAFDAARTFQSLWREAQSTGKGLCKPGVDDLLAIEIDQCQEFIPGPAGDVEGEYAPPLTAVKILDSDDVVFNLYRDCCANAAEEAITAAIRAATIEINLWQERFTRNLGGGTLPFMEALDDVIRSNDDQNNETFKVRLLLNRYHGTKSFLNGWNRNGVRQLYDMIDSSRESYFEVKLFMGGPSDYRMHAKALSIDSQLVIIGSQNWDHSAWGNRGVNLAELNFGLDAIAVPLYNGMFFGFWEDEDIAKAPCDVAPFENWGDSFVSCLLGWNTATLEGEEQNTASEDVNAPIVWLDGGIYAGSNLLLDQPVDVVGLGPETILEPEPGTPAGEPLIHITSSNVSLVGLTLRNSTGYAIEIGDGVTPVENVFISRSVFENNAYGGVKINGPASVYYVENNTFVGGEAGIVINVSGMAAENAVVRNNIFSDQTDAPVRVDSTNDGGVSYSYNLFDNCIRAENGVCPQNWLLGAMHTNSTEHHNLINTPPNFNDPANGDYSLAYPSAAIDAGDPATTSALDSDGIGDGIARADIGAIPFVPDPDAWQLTPLSPQPGETAVITTTVPVTFTWDWLDETLPAPGSYRFQLATDAQFLNLITDTQVTTITHPVYGLGDVYYWRVGHGAPEEWAQVRQLIVPNSDPVAKDDEASTPQNTSVIIDVLANDYDRDGDLLSIASVAPPIMSGTVTVNPDDTLTYTPPRGYTGTVFFSYTISDGRGGTDTALVTVVVYQK